ncbi:branched-chain amino acid transport system ATP-binding protein [Geodermatophilus bullaregiensis]|uniref:ABC transporter ATP-binding protein n=1 Tax=Geodermatophilus bullaregiensis TaxID=1564160 RepID=UPI00195C6F2A|nr:ABC transporter ATP-binding protein [Geodermatophilus bullaregiensis]MBM7808728.1 branched-chain amino acid transport system ATP-binding protein [Geodermatophilus bullaregiensis]
MLEIADLHVRYATAEAVRGVGLSATPGRVTLVLGANGAGKTSTLRAAAGLVRPHAGRVTLDGRDVTGLAPHRIVRAGMVLVPEGRRVFAPLTVEENLVLGGYTASRERSREVLERVFTMFPILRERRSGPAGLLSGGEQQMLAFGRALMSSPRVIMLDEPSMGLAPTMVESVLEAVRAMADEGLSVLLVEQNAELGLEVADDVVAMARGEVVFTGPAAQARSNASVLRAFLGEAALTGQDA